MRESSTLAHTDALGRDNVGALHASTRGAQFFTFTHERAGQTFDQPAWFAGAMQAAAGPASGGVGAYSLMMADRLAKLPFISNAHQKRACLHPLSRSCGGVGCAFQFIAFLLFTCGRSIAKHLVRVALLFDGGDNCHCKFYHKRHS